MIPAEVASLTFDASFLMGMVFSGITKDGFKSPVRTECYEPRCLLAPVPEPRIEKVAASIISGNG